MPRSKFEPTIGDAYDKFQKLRRRKRTWISWICLGTTHSFRAYDFLYLLFMRKREGQCMPHANRKPQLGYDCNIVNSSHSLATVNQNYSKCTYRLIIINGWRRRWTFENSKEFLEQFNTYTVHSSVWAMFAWTSNRNNIYVAYFLCLIVNRFGPSVRGVVDLDLSAPIYLKYILNRPKQRYCHRVRRRS